MFNFSCELVWLLYLHEKDTRKKSFPEKQIKSETSVTFCEAIFVRKVVIKFHQMAFKIFEILDLIWSQFFVENFSLLLKFHLLNKIRLFINRQVISELPSWTTRLKICTEVSNWFFYENVPITSKRNKSSAIELKSCRQFWKKCICLTVGDFYRRYHSSISFRGVSINYRTVFFLLSHF